jgi:hypothetical protein
MIETTFRVDMATVMESGVCMSQGPQFVTRLLRTYRRLLMVVSGSNCLAHISRFLLCFRREERETPIARVMTAAQAAESTCLLVYSAGYDLCRMLHRPIGSRIQLLLNNINPVGYLQ